MCVASRMISVFLGAFLTRFPSVSEFSQVRLTIGAETSSARTSKAGDQRNEEDDADEYTL